MEELDVNSLLEMHLGYPCYSRFQEAGFESLWNVKSWKLYERKDLEVVE